MVSPYLTISEAGALLRRREISSVELVRDHLERIDKLNPALNAYLSVTPDFALVQAARADAKLARGEGNPLTGIPMALKDIMSIRGVVTTCGSRMLEDYIPQYTCTAADRLFHSGAVMLGKTNMDEFAMGSSTENSAFGSVCNPWDTSRVPGGSSGGSAAAVAAGTAIFALGTDTGGSIRQPAALTGTVGLKPTYGRVSRNGLVAFASSLDQIGPFGRCVKDVATVLQCIAGHDEFDSTSLNAPVPDYVSHLNGDLRGIRLGLPIEYFEEGMDPGVAGVVEEAIRTLRSLGATVVDVSLPHTLYGLSTYYVISPAEAMSNLARYDGVRYGLSVPGGDIWELYDDTRAKGFGREVKRRILLGTYVLSSGYYDAYYLKAQQVRTLVRRDFTQVFTKVDALITPTSPTVAFPLGEKMDDPMQMYLSDVYTVPANIAGVCGISIPCGFHKDLPVGLQILGAPLGEATILRVAEAYERSTDFHFQHPTLAVTL
ncbi:MAG: Asp-tRNA(Asn)/Glu-tRNA(Gln) amidotransferase subunit GatA [Chloroflexota bacterium]